MDAHYWLLDILMVLILLSLWSSGASGENLRRIKRIERKIDLILGHLGLDPNQGVDQQVLELVKAGRKIEAIKAYRELTQVGLKEAKDYVEGL